MVYHVPCEDCICVYTGVMERRYGIWEKKHQQDVRHFEKVKFTQAIKKDSVSVVNPSAITHHITRNNHTMDWEGVKFPVETVTPPREAYWRT